MRAIINPGDKVIVPLPSYVSYGPVVELAGGRAVYVDTAAQGFKLTPPVLEKVIDKKTKAVILNYPTNPTGVTYTKNELGAIKKVALKHGLLVVSDEVYGDLTYDFEHTPFASLPGARDNTVYLDGFSKSYAMTGWRIGYACGAKEIIAAMTKIHQYTIMCVPITSQMAGCEALVSGRKSIDQMKQEYRRRREFVISRLNEMGLVCSKPQGAFYAFPAIKNTGLSSIDFCQQLLKEYKVAVVPGTAFGACAEGYIRISYASSMENLKEALNRIEKFLQRYG
jgi:aminotransferase